jgi:hypothetical protein
LHNFRPEVWQAGRYENEVHCPRFRCRRSAENGGLILCKDYTKREIISAMLVPNEKTSCNRIMCVTHAFNGKMPVRLPGMKVIMNYKGSWPPCPRRRLKLQWMA